MTKIFFEFYYFSLRRKIKQLSLEFLKFVGNYLEVSITKTKSHGL